MNKKLFIFGLVGLLFINILSATEAAYEIIFYAHGRGKYVEGDKSIAGHAFVQVENFGTYGFYPPGILKDDTNEIERATVIRRFEVDIATWNRIKQEILSWRGKNNYMPGGNDCINLVYAVADIIGLYHDRFITSGTLFPTTAVNSIRKR